MLATGLSCYAIASLLGAVQPLNLTYWAMSFPAMSKHLYALSNCSNRSDWGRCNVSCCQSFCSNKRLGVTAEYCFRHRSHHRCGMGINLQCSLCNPYRKCVPAEIQLMTDIGGNAIQESNPDRQQLIKGFQAQFWFSFGSATLGALGALTLKLGRRGTHDEIRKERITRKAEQDQIVQEQEKLGTESSPTVDQSASEQTI
jgi:hypothetical protein